MSDINFEIKTYEIYFHAKQKPSESAAIFIKGADPSHRAILYFMDRESEIEPAYFSSSNGIYFAYYHKSRLAEMIDSLRNEKPMSCATNTRDPSTAFILIYSGSEPIGEGEF